MPKDSHESHAVPIQRLPKIVLHKDEEDPDTVLMAIEIQDHPFQIGNVSVGPNVHIGLGVTIGSQPFPPELVQISKSESKKFLDDLIRQLDSL